ncbi:MAG: 50S ribosomal protein L29 [Rhodothermia bacterium]|nr:MAG: 50S ribosomal protein L29 [Rhodothermia bacterium]
MKATEIRELSSKEIVEHIKDEVEQLSHLRFQHAIADLHNPMILQEKRRLIARFQTILRMRDEGEQTVTTD